MRPSILELLGGKPVNPGKGRSVPAYSSKPRKARRGKPISVLDLLNGGKKCG